MQITDRSFEILIDCVNASHCRIQIRMPKQVVAERIRLAACRAGGDTLFIEAELADGCKEEDWDGKRSVPRGVYTVYRLNR